MKRNILVVAIVLLLFATVLIVARLNDNSDASASDKHWYTNAIGSLIDKEPLRSRDIAAPCFAPVSFRVVAGSGCRARVLPSDVRERVFRLRLVSGLKASVLLEPAGKYSVSIKAPLKTQNPETPNFQAPEDGATLTLTCEQPMPATSPCIISLASAK